MTVSESLQIQNKGHAYPQRLSLHGRSCRDWQGSNTRRIQRQGKCLYLRRIRTVSPRKTHKTSVFHRAFFNSIMDKTPTHALFYSTLY